MKLTLAKATAVAAATVAAGIGGVVAASQPAAAANLTTCNWSGSSYNMVLRDSRGQKAGQPPGTCRNMQYGGRALWIPTGARVDGIGGTGYWAQACNQPGYWKSFSWNPTRITFKITRC